MISDLMARLLPVLGRSLDASFNVFDVMHHGTHEKQLSNVFRWIFEIGGTHNFGALGQQLFVELINEEKTRLGQVGDLVPQGPYAVRQEVNTANAGDEDDIADIVLDCDSAVIVVENYGTSDGHGHEYEGYLAYGRRDDRATTVVLLCHEEDRSLQIGGWQQAPVVTYERLLDRLIASLAADRDYAKNNEEQNAFIGQMHRKFANGKGRMSDKNSLEFVAAMCAAGEAGRYQQRDKVVAAEQFANDLAQQAREQFVEGREVLRRVKSRLLSYGSTALAGQLNVTQGAGFVANVTANWRGIYEWTINFEPDEAHDSFKRALAGRNSKIRRTHQILFGPSAWHANEVDTLWNHRIDPTDVDYSRLFLTNAVGLEIRQSAVSLQEVIDGLDPNDTRLHDEIVAMRNAV